MRKYLAECIGTFTLVLFGCGAAVIAGASVGVLGIAFAFGFALIAMASISALDQATRQIPELTVPTPAHTFTVRG